MKDLFKGCVTIPNLLSVIRILMTPVVAILFYNDMKIEAVIVLAVSALTDTFDGQIARKFNQVSALGKILDPVADKISQLTIAVILLVEFHQAADPFIKAFGYVFIVFLAKEAIMLIGGLVMLLFDIRPGAAEFYGKAATVVFYVGMVGIMLFGPEVGAFAKYFTLPNFITGAIIVICAIMTIIAFASYMPETFRQFKERFSKFEYEPLGDRLEKLRRVKTEREIEKIRAAQALAEAAYAYILPRIEVGRTELSLAAELEYYMKRNGASGPSFDTICVSGSRSSLPHGTPTEARLEKNCFITMDFGCKLDGYSSDMTRTVCLGKADEEMKKVYETVLLAQETALKKIKAGLTGKEIDAAARDVIAAAGYGDCFGHSLGHGIGLKVHEAPSFSPSFEEAIPAGAVMSVEPGIYLPGKFGVRIEDLVVVRETGFENLNTSSKLLLEL